MAAVITSKEIINGVTFLVVAKGTTREDLRELQHSPCDGPRCITVPPDISPEENARRFDIMNRVAWRLILDLAKSAAQKGNETREQNI